MSIVDVIERARREPPYEDPRSLFPGERYVCTVFDPVPWDRGEIERKLGVEIPSELATLWDNCGGLILYEDNLHHQWGLSLCAPSDPDLFALNKEHLEDIRDCRSCAMPGDLIIGSFWGDRDRPLIRCDKNAADYGSITIVAGMGPRSEWDSAAGSLEEFLVRFMDTHGDKYWEYHYKKKVAERATEDLLRAKRVN